MQPEALETMKRLILPLADVLTPNLPEAEALTGLSIRRDKDMQKAAQMMMETGAKSVVIRRGPSKRAKRRRTCCLTEDRF